MEDGKAVARNAGSGRTFRRDGPRCRGRIFISSLLESDAAYYTARMFQGILTLNGGSHDLLTQMPANRGATIENPEGSTGKDGAWLDPAVGP